MPKLPLVLLAPFFLPVVAACTSVTNDLESVGKTEQQFKLFDQAESYLIAQSQSGSSIPICLTGSGVTDTTRPTYQNHIRDAIVTWIDGAQPASTVSLIDGSAVTFDCSNPRVTVNWSSANGRAYMSGNFVQLYQNDGFSTALHEFGHIFGIGDTYQEGIWTCDPQQPNSVMCGYGGLPVSLQSDDEYAIRTIYCAAFPDQCANRSQMSSVFSAARTHTELFRRGADGYLNFYYVNPTWTKDASSFLASRVTGDISAVYSRARNHSEVFFQGEDGNLHYYFVNQGVWNHDGTSFTGAGKLTGHISAVYSPLRNHSEVFVQGADRTLQYFYVDSGKWQRDPTRPGAGERLMGDIAAVFSKSRNHSEVYFVGHDNRLRFSYVESGSWHHDAESFNAAGAVAGEVAAVYSDARQHSEVFVRGYDGLLHYFYVEANGWHHDGSSFASAGEVDGEISAVYSPARAHSEVFFKGKDGQVHYFYVSGGSWQHDSLSFAAGGAMARDLTTVLAPQRQSSEFFFLGADSVPHYFYVANGWQHDGSNFL